MKRRLLLALTLACGVVVFPASAGAIDDVCNYGRMASNAATAPGSMQAFTESSGPLTINQNQTNLPPGQEEKGLLGCSPE